jgi:hypothetical protein
LYYFSPALATFEQQKLTKVTVLVDEIDLGHVFIIDPNDPTNLIKAECTNPEYAQGLTMYAHLEAQKIKKQMAQADLRRLGEKANLIARWHLLKKIQEDLQRKKPKLRQLVIDFPEEIKNLSMPIKPCPIVAEEQQATTGYTAFSSMEI